MNAMDQVWMGEAIAAIKLHSRCVVAARTDLYHAIRCLHSCSFGPLSALRFAGLWMNAHRNCGRAMMTHARTEKYLTAAYLDFCKINGKVQSARARDHSGTSYHDACLNADQGTLFTITMSFPGDLGHHMMAHIDSYEFDSPISPLAENLAGELWTFITGEMLEYASVEDISSNLNVHDLCLPRLRHSWYSSSPDARSVFEDVSLASLDFDGWRDMRNMLEMELVQSLRNLCEIGPIGEDDDNDELVDKDRLALYLEVLPKTMKNYLSSDKDSPLLKDVKLIGNSYDWSAIRPWLMQRFPRAADKLPSSFKLLMSQIEFCEREKSR